jgi:hypothetical protein
MDTTMLIVLIAAAAVVVLALAAGLWLQHRNIRRSRELRRDFGPEYDRTLDETGDRQRAERDLASRRERVARLELRDISPEDRERFRASWMDAQSRFVDDPAAALRESDSLIGEVMRTRGYPVDDFDQQAADLSVDHGDVIDHYREAHAVTERSGDDTDTEEVRQAMLHYRALFDDMLAVPASRKAS